MSSSADFKLGYNVTEVTQGGPHSNPPAPAIGGGGGGGGTVTSINTGTGLTGGPITTSGTIAIAPVISPTGPIGDSTHVAVVTVNAEGQVTALTSVAITSGGTGDVVGPASAVAGDITSFDGTTGKLIKDSGWNITSGVLTAPSGARMTDVTDLFLFDNPGGTGLPALQAGTKTPIYLAGDWPGWGMNAFNDGSVWRFGENSSTAGNGDFGSFFQQRMNQVLANGALQYAVSNAAGTAGTQLHYIICFLIYPNGHVVLGQGAVDGNPLADDGVNMLQVNGSMRVSSLTSGVVVGDASGNLTTTPAGTRAPFDVANFGATGNGSTNDFSAISAANTAAAAVGGQVVFSYGSAGHVFVCGTSITFSAPVLIEGDAQLSPSTGVVMTFAQQLIAPCKQVFVGAGTVALAETTPVAWVDWWNGGDAGAAANLGATACYTGQSSIGAGGVGATLTFAAKNYIFNTTFAPATYVPINALPGGNIVAGTATNGITLPPGNVEGYLQFPSIMGFSSGWGIRLNRTNLVDIKIGFIYNCAVGIELFADTGSPNGCLDNGIRCQSIYLCPIAIKCTVNTAGGPFIQGNQVDCNFVNSCKSWVTFAGANSNSNKINQNTFSCDAFDPAGVGSVIMINNSMTSSAANQNNFVIRGFCGNFNAGDVWIHGGSATNNNIDQSLFDFGDGFINTGGTSAQSYATINNPEFAQGWGSTYRTSQGAKLNNNGGIACATSPASRATWGASGGSTAGQAIFYNRMLVQMAISGLAAGATATFYAYHPFVQGNARLQLTSSNDIGNALGMMVESIADNTLTNANEIKIVLRNVSGSTQTGTASFTLIVGIP